MLVLGIETSGLAGSLALVRDQQLLVERPLAVTGRRHARMLVAELQQMMVAAQLNFSDLDCLAVSIGPGSFTGLRVGVVCAKTLAYAIQRPLVAIDTFRAIASGLPATVERVAILDDALRGDIFVGEYVRLNAGWQVIQPAGLVSVSQWLETLGPRRIHVAGPGLRQHAAALRPYCELVAEDLWAPEARWIATLGGDDFQRGMTTDHWQLEPFYIRRSAAEEKADSPLP